MKETPKPAPILLFVYNRLDSLQRTIENLKANYLAPQSDLIIFSDGAKTRMDIDNVQAVRDYINDMTGFKSISITERKNNYGLAKNIIEGVSEIIKKSKKVIVLEDDLLTSKNFLCYMNKALDHYESRKDIFSISGYTADLKSTKQHKYDTYLSLRVSSWGWATWLDQWENIDWVVYDFNNFINDNNKVKSFNLAGADMARMLRKNREGKNNSWAIRYAYSMFKQKKYCIYPKNSKIKNIGFNSEATNTKNSNIYKSNFDTKNKRNFIFDDSHKPDENILKEFRKQFSLLNKLIMKTKFLFLREEI